MFRDSFLHHSLRSPSISKTVLDNGITVLCDRDERFSSAALALCLLGGRRGEPEQEAGITHMLEHLLFKRTSLRGTKEIAVIIDELGGEANAFTDHQSICLHGVVPASMFMPLFDLFAELLNNNAFSEKDLELEKEVIRQEILEGQGDPVSMIYQQFSQSFWPDSAIGTPVYGKLENLEHFNSELLCQRLDFLRQGSRLIVAAAGNVDPEMLTAFVQRSFDGWIRGGRDSFATPAVGSGRELYSRPIGQVHIILGRKWPHLQHERYLAGMILASMLGEGVSSRLFQLLREERGLAYDVEAEVDSFADTAGLVVSAAVDRANAESALDLILGEIEKMRQSQISAVELERAVRMQSAQLVMEGDSVSDRLWRAMESEVIFGRYVSAQEVMEKLNRLSLDDFRELAAEWLTSPEELLLLGGDVEGYKLSR